MERLRSLTLTAVAAALAAPGCIHVHTDADGKVKSVELKAAEKAAPAADPGVQPAAATVPAPAVPAAVAGVGKQLAPVLAGLTAAPQPAEMTIIWQNRVVQLPDPTRQGAFGNGLVGQMFLFGAGKRMPYATADGKLTVELFDETPRAGAPRSERLGSWTFPKEVLKALVTADERFGKCHALFLPWPSYTPAVSRVKLTAKFEPETGFPIYAVPSTITLDPTGGEAVQVVRTTTLTPPAPPGPVVMPATPPAAPAPFQPPIPVYPPSPGANGPAAPANLPPIALTLPGR